MSPAGTCQLHNLGQFISFCLSLPSVESGGDADSDAGLVGLRVPSTQQAMQEIWREATAEQVRHHPWKQVCKQAGTTEGACWQRPVFGGKAVPQSSCSLQALNYKKSLQFGHNTEFEALPDLSPSGQKDLLCRGIHDVVTGRLKGKARVYSASKRET
ncbi:uncharacterized protein LOC115304892 isoform X1 [Suricata suricatta]|uniref:uncharacterized protein LOC115304892 isoform X1 n=1 Tax=Suricata suricatta TaxID=37032 RepID=UPI0011556243|nr:uncharacterized protein LOC115304892 isoform X1 [Suricata suricatta]